jgi:hypothetical protein
MVPSTKASGFCENTFVGNYDQPLKEMPTLREVGLDRQLPFGPRGVYLLPGQEGPILPRGNIGVVGYALRIPPGSLPDSNPNLPRLNWLVTAKLARIDLRGRLRKALDFRRRRITGPKGHKGFYLRKPSSLGFYRVEIVFRNGAGRRLARYGQYLRIVRPSSGARFTVNATSYRPGETVSGCVENLGTTPVEFGDCVGASSKFSIQAFDGAAWMRAPIDPPEPCADVGLVLGPFRVASAGSFTIPTDAPSGLYRAWLSDTLTTEFTILTVATRVAHKRGYTPSRGDIKNP